MTLLPTKCPNVIVIYRMNTSDYDILAPDDIKVNLNHVCLQIYGKAFTIYFNRINIRCLSVRESARTLMKRWCFYPVILEGRYLLLLRLLRYAIKNASAIDNQVSCVL